MSTERRASFPESSAGPSPEPEPPVNVLLVDDAEENLLALEAVLRDLGHNLVLARSGEEALKVVLDLDLAVILLDVRMPGLDGYETAALIRSRPASMHTPIVFVTAADATTDQVAHGYSVGAVDYIFKPIQPDILRSKVAVFVDLFRKSERLRRQGAELLKMKELEHELRLSAVERRRNRFFALSVDMMCLVGADGLFREVNPAWGRTLGLDPSQLEGRAVLEWVHPDELPGFATFWGEVLRSEATRVWEGRFRSEAGWRWLSWSARAYPDEALVYAVVRDITPHREALEALDRHARDLARSNADLEQFAFIASHDLREPLRVVTSYAQLLGKRYRGSLDADADEFLGFLVSAASRMEDLVGGLLRFAQLGRDAESLVEVDLNAAAAEACQNLARLVADSGAMVDVEPLPCVSGSRLGLVMLLQNLIENAIKYRGKQAPRIRISAAPLDAWWQVSVRDNGIGIEPRHHDRIFRIFQRLPGGERQDGTGIGLAIAARVVSGNGGRIWVDSAPGHGSTFHFTWPRDPGGR